ncbi:tRNA1Val (adenine37-N6)-methyltransferase [Pseudoalteromonas espejiana DSM 9414]|uniref:tRNA1(Val) (adenine(37)-N6)-methyltransferase n=1 Tax=Pseudoalteromonas espejiana TaxID=28107 RepID=A0A510XV10_9GAMM|nr:methyltransferase [Pseudoalteromonas espejiana]ASM48913.1 tRNA1Val (adenine37-N6)-methyltransferase [Pseudoalteromonas espejiana DSM 9414]GEK54829.1 tRNA1(Val) (adenine(37)-N6)-methyltransferase [Pseudoalteromonas espejiana]
MSGFTFKQFKVEHDKCAMKVSTDGILLGAWANLNGAQSLLDIGTGTGLLALMCKQRSSGLAITAVEVDEAAYNQALKNCASSPWPNINIEHTTIQSFEHAKPFDVVISNPPYFNNSLKGESDTRNTARHTDGLSFDELINAFKRLSHSGSRFSLILPSIEGALFIKLATQNGLYLNVHCQVKATPNKDISRSLMTFSYVKSDIESSILCIRNLDNSYTVDYVALCKAFYLKM